MFTHSTDESFNLFAPDQPGVWLKANLHTHTDKSDATWTVDECLTFYAEHGYDLIAITDHWKLTDASACANDLMLLPGTELNGWTEPAVQHHILGLGLTTIPDRAATASLASTVAAIGEVGGLAIVAHPEWSKQTAEHLASTPGVCLLEVYNATSQIREGNGVSSAQWDALLNRGERWFAIASDDTHMLPGYEDRGKGWIYLRAAEHSVRAALDAIAAGRFWSTTGPSLVNVALDSTGPLVTVECSPCREIRVITGPTSYSYQDPHGMGVTHAEIPIPPTWRWFRVECHDADGGIAWSNPVFSPRF